MSSTSRSSPLAPLDGLVLVADDDAQVRAGLTAMCRASGLRTLQAENGQRAVELSAREEPDVVLLDLRMPGRDGLDALAEINALPNAPHVIVVTGVADVSVTVRVMQMGALALLEKPVHLDDLKDNLRTALQREKREPFEIPRTRAIIDEEDEDEGHALAQSVGLIGHSAAIKQVMHLVQRIAAAPRSTVLIGGESGVGKELVARAVHQLSVRCDEAFVPINCAALSDGLLEAELFGYEPGAFTGGRPDGHKGLIAAAEGGTLFLDEVGELAPQAQAKLLRVLEERRYRRVGGSRDLPMNVRIVAATNRDLGQRVEEGAFRSDLFYRLNVLSVLIPPLRERPGDILPISEYILAHLQGELGRPCPLLGRAALSLLEEHQWPGNVRQLRNTLERALLYCQGSTIRPEDIDLESASEDEPLDTDNPLVSLTDWNLKKVEKMVIRRVVEECSGNRSRAARELGINRTTLYNKLRQYGIEA